MKASGAIESRAVTFTYRVTRAKLERE